MRVPVLTRTATVILAGLLAVTGCASNGTSPSAPSGVGDLGDAPDAGTSPSAAGRIGDSGASAGPTGGTGNNTGGTGNTGGQSAPKPPATARAATGPAIGYFRVKQKPSCPAGTNVNPIDGTPVVLEWKVTSVDNVALSVDGPGIYADNYPPTGTETLNFTCSGKEGDVQRHTYQLTVTNASGKVTKTLEVTATVHERATV